MRLFESDCPQQLMTEMRLQERRKRQEEVGIKEEKLGEKILLIWTNDPQAGKLEKEIQAKIQLMYEQER